MGREKANVSGFGGKGLDRFDKDRDMMRKLQRKAAFGDEEEETAEIEGTEDAIVATAAAPSATTSTDASKTPIDKTAGSKALTPLQAVEKARLAIQKISSRLKIGNQAKLAADGNEVGEFNTTLEINDFPRMLFLQLCNTLLTINRESPMGCHKSYQHRQNSGSDRNINHHQRQFLSSRQSCAYWRS